ncbi:patatin-like phospholipase family protein [Thermodesulfobacteriota bacterium]
MQTPFTEKKGFRGNPPRIGIALGGGGARGLAHLGVLMALEEEHIPIHCISGTSAGAIIGAMYAQNPDAKTAIEQIKASFSEGIYEQLQLNCLKNASNSSFLHQFTQRIKRSILISFAQSKRALLSDVCFRDNLTRFIKEGNIEDTKIPFGIVATSLHSGEDVYFTSGDILTAVTASSAISGFLTPVDLNEDLLTDGAVSCPVPVTLLKDMGAETTIGVEISNREFTPLEEVNVIEIIARAEMIESIRLSEMMVKTADVAICPNTKDIHWSDFSRIDELIEAGLESAREKLPDIHSAIQRMRPWYRRLYRTPSGIPHALKVADWGTHSLKKHIYKVARGGRDK